MANLKLNLTAMNQQRVTILVADVANIAELQAGLVAQGFLVDVCTDAKKLYSELSVNGAPGYVFISRALTDPMAKILPDFVTKHFKVPVFLFRESDSGQVEFDPGTLPPEIMPLASLDPERVINDLKGFPELYVARVRDGVSTQMPITPSEEPLVDSGRAQEQIMHALKNVFEISEFKLEKNEPLVLHTLRVSEGTTNEHFVFASPSRAQSMAEALDVIQGCVKMVLGEDNSRLLRIDEGVQNWFFDELKSRADEALVGQLKGSEVCVLYFGDRAPVAEVSAKEVTEGTFIVPMEEWWTYIALPCPAYLWLGLNERRILFVRAGQQMRIEAFDRLRARGYEILAVDGSRLTYYRQIREMVRVAIEKPKVSAS